MTTVEPMTIPREAQCGLTLALQLQERRLVRDEDLSAAAEPEKPNKRRPRAEDGFFFFLVASRPAMK